MLDSIKAQIVQILVEKAELSASDISFDRPIEEVGIRSADAVYMCGLLEEQLGIEIEPALIFETATLDEFAREIAAMAADAR